LRFIYSAISVLLFLLPSDQANEYTAIILSSLQGQILKTAHADQLVSLIKTTNIFVKRFKDASNKKPFYDLLCLLADILLKNIGHPLICE